MKNFELPKLYPITDTKISGLSHAEQVEQFITGGAKLIQLREKHAAPQDFFRDAVKAISIARKHHVKILINDRVDIALAARADGVHLGQNDLPPAEARKILGENAIIGFSTHNQAQAISALELPVDYIAIGPIFATSTKENPDAVLGLENLQVIRQAIGKFPLVAIGGISKESARFVLEAGANSVALISALLKNPDAISEETTKFLKILSTK